MKVSDGIADDDQCYLPRPRMDAVEIESGHQVRLVYDGEPAIFTADVSDNKFGYVSNDGRDRLGANSGSFRVQTRSMVVNPKLDEVTASEQGGFIEQLTDPGMSGLVALAPHGGYVEWGTDSQAERVSERIDATAWRSAGWWPGGGAFRRWHIDSTAIHPASFPALNDISDRGFEYAVSFHGWSESHVAIGGAGSEELRKEIRDAIANVVDCEVRLSSDNADGGDSPENIVNWMTDSGSYGIQIEQPSSVRDERHLEVADAVSETFTDWLEGGNQEDVNTSGLQAAIDDWRNEEIDTSTLVNLINIWRGSV